MLTSITALNYFLQHHLGWSSIQQVFRVTRECTWTDRTTGERRISRDVAYGNPICRVIKPAPRDCCIATAANGRSRTDCSTSATKPSAKTATA